MDMHLCNMMRLWHLRLWQTGCTGAARFLLGSVVVGSSRYGENITSAQISRLLAHFCVAARRSRTCKTGVPSGRPHGRIFRAGSGVREVSGPASFGPSGAVGGHDVGKLGLGDFVDPDNATLPYLGFPLPPPWLWGAQLGLVLCIRERGTKTYTLSRAPPVYLWPNQSEPRLCVQRVLALYLSLCAAPDAPPGSAVADTLFRPLSPDRRGFKDGPLTSSSMGARLRLHLHGAGLYGGETVHSFRRGALQNAQALGLGQSSLLNSGQLRTVAVLERYLDRNRHSRDVRLRL